MLADQLTKKMLSPVLMKFLTTGEWTIDVKERYVRIRRGDRRPATYTEKDLQNNMFEISNGDLGEQLLMDEEVISLMEFLSTYDKAN